MWSDLAPQLARVQHVLALEPGWSEYRLVEHLSARFSSPAALMDAVQPDATERLYLEWLLYANNVVLRADYRELLFS